MTVGAPKYEPGNPHRELQCQETLDSVMRDIIAEANERGWSRMETMNGMEEVLRNMRLAYAEDPDPEDDPLPGDTGDSNDFGEFPAAEGLVKASIEGREKP